MKKIILLALLLNITCNAQPLSEKLCTNISRYSNGEIKKCKLSGVVEINSHNYSGWIWFYEGNKIKQCTSEDSITYGNYTIPKGSIVFYSKLGLIEKVWLSKMVVYDGIKCLAKNNEIEVSFYSNKKMKSCFLSEDQCIQGWFCLASITHPVYFHENGSLKKFTLSKTTEKNGKIYLKNKTLILDLMGEIVE